MTHIDAVVDMDNLARRIAEGYITERRSNGLRLWNYTAKTQYDRAWDQETRRCRGLVATDGGIVVARPFEKFFNVGEHASLPVEPFDVYEKLDGSLIVVAQGPDKISITSRGSFDSEHAAAGRKLWSERHADVQVPAGQTWCFELIAPWNRIVVDYSGRTDLVLLAAIDNATGKDLPLPAPWPGARVRTFDFADTGAITSRLSMLGPDEEGYVIRFRASGLLVKAKGDEYVRLHRLLTGLTARGVWEVLSTGAPVLPLLERVPDEFNKWVRATVKRLTREYVAISRAAHDRLDAIADLPTRKEQALAIADFPYRAVVFRMLDGKPHDDIIWKAIYPGVERPFRALTPEDM